jgi:hypothetical protein
LKNFLIGINRKEGKSAQISENLRPEQKVFDNKIHNTPIRKLQGKSALLMTLLKNSVRVNDAHYM